VDPHLAHHHNPYLLVYELVRRLARFGSAPLCNGKAHRAPQIGTFVFFLCYRCVGLVLGGGLGYLLLPPKSLFFAILLLPMAIDALLQSSGLLESTNFRRLTTGVLFGVGLHFIF
jgi:uncharacterized membrane protein